MDTLNGKVALVTGASAIDFAIGAGREAGDLALEEMMSPDDVEDVVLFAVTRPRGIRILTTSFRPMSEPAWG